MPIFLDTNVLIYAFSSDHRREIAWRIVTESFHISVQSLNEFANVSRRKLRQDWSEVEDKLSILIELADVVHPVRLETHVRGVRIAERYGLQVYDSFLAAAALLAGCETFFSEDLQDGLVIDDRLTVRNPFA